MRGYLSGLLLLGLALPAFGVDKAELDARMRKLTTDLAVLQAKPDKAIPAQSLRQAQAVVLLNRVKAGFGFAFQGGSGVAFARDPSTGQWSAPAFVNSSEASLGFQLGGQQSFVVILIMNVSAAHALAEGSSNFGGEASGTAGSASASVQSPNSDVVPLSLVYSDTGGLFAGAAVKGGSITPDNDADNAYYGQFLTMKEILFDHKVKPTPASQDLTHRLDQYAK